VGPRGKGGGIVRGPTGGGTDRDTGAGIPLTWPPPRPGGGGMGNGPRPGGAGSEPGRPGGGGNLPGGGGSGPPDGGRLVTGPLACIGGADTLSPDGGASRFGAG
jgi:hypothetical protein